MKETHDSQNRKGESKKGLLNSVPSNPPSGPFMDNIQEHQGEAEIPGEQTDARRRAWMEAFKTFRETRPPQGFVFTRYNRGKYLVWVVKDASLPLGFCAYACMVHRGHFPKDPTYHLSGADESPFRIMLGPGSCKLLNEVFANRVETVRFGNTAKNHIVMSQLLQITSSDKSTGMTGEFV